MQSVTRVGIDLAKMFIQVHAVDAVGKLVCNKQLSREKFIAWCNQLPAGCLVAMEACSGSHAWARKLIALGLDAKIIAANHVAPYRLEGKGWHSPNSVDKYYCQNLNGRNANAKSKIHS